MNGETETETDVPLATDVRLPKKQKRRIRKRRIKTISKYLADSIDADAMVLIQTSLDDLEEPGANKIAKAVEKRMKKALKAFKRSLRD